MASEPQSPSCCGSCFLRRTTLSGAAQDLIQPHQDRGYCGAFLFLKPAVFLWDPDMVKQVLTSNFSSFHDRGLPHDENDPQSAILFSLKGARWRELRNKLSPTFTSGKLKLMYPLMKDVTGELRDAILVDTQASCGPVKLMDLVSRFATDVIGSCAFGIECKPLHNKEDEFLSMGRAASKGDLVQFIRIILLAIHPALARLLPMEWVMPKARTFFLNLMKDSVEHREKNKVVRNDFVHLLMQLRESERAEENPENRTNFTNSVMTAQAFLFFTAGQENTTIVVSFCLHQLALHPAVQRRAVEEVRAVLAAHDGQLTYEAVQKMELVERIFKEGLRMWSPLGVTLRNCNATSRVGDTVIEKGEWVMICIDAMHMDPHNFPDPTRFDPDRFTEEAEARRHPYAYLPFGAGPRMCIAERFAMLEMKMVLAFLLNEFHFTPCDKTERTPEPDLMSAVLKPKNGFWVQANARI